MAGIFNNRNFKVGQLCCLAFALLLGVGCSSEVKMDQRLVDTFVELRLADMSFGGDSPMARLYRQDVLKKSGYTREQYLEKVATILDNEEQWVPFQRAVNERIDSLLAVRKSMAATPSVPKSGPPKTRKGVVDDE